ncbi:MAG: OmpA/MotB family protein [Thermodesulfobacteriota bacterium]
MPGKKKKQASGNTGSWITTFTNLVLLLLAFFVVLVVMSEPNEEKMMAGLSSLFGAFGITPDGLSSIGSDQALDITEEGAPVTKAQAVQNRLQEIVVSNGLLSDTEMKREGGRVVLSLSNRVFFEFGSSRLHEQTDRFLQDLAGVIEGETGQVELRGYADHSETVFSEDPLLSAYDLSVRRALAIHHFLLNEEGIQLEQIVAHGFGTRPGRKPISNQEAWRDSQMEIILDYSTKLPYRMRTEEGRSPFLEYKGFLFRRLGN